MVDGASVLMTFIHGMKALGAWGDGGRGTNLLDTGAHFYEVYETKDGQYVSIGSIEPQFYALLLEHTGLAGEDMPHQMDRSAWPAQKERLKAIFKRKTRDEWCVIMEGTDVCFAPVLGMSEAPEHPHIKARHTYVDHYGIVQPAPAPRFDRTEPRLTRPPAHAGQHTDEVLGEYGLSRDEIGRLRDTKAIA